ncbi:MAG: 3-oxoacyl-ACP reductase FabG [Candidatus Latescibacteria bacterium]|jgi:NAD(P)-dependent dehydrogenase (short-subunit alcohol dehydrogenase family)|nr:3-oxoacyl-ACP reductase FabG [Candidatus Latescibacterota bacterium]
MSGNESRRKCALVTGASKGVGRGIALALGKAGYDVAVNYRTDEAGAEDTMKHLVDMGCRAITHGAHVGNRDQVRAMVAKVIDKLGGLDLLVNNAGITLWGPILELSEQVWDDTIETNLKGTFLCTQAAGRHMAEHGGGRIVNIGSGAGKRPFPGASAYNASKGGIEMFTQVSAVELGPRGITVNCVAPGAVEIERTRIESPDYAETWGSVTPMRRVGVTDDVGSAVVFLASEASEFITGQTIYVDGGLFTQAVWPYEKQ